MSVELKITIVYEEVAMKDIMMVKANAKIYTVKYHDGTSREYTIDDLPMYVMTWMMKRTATYDTAGNTCWL